MHLTWIQISVCVCVFSKTCLCIHLVVYQAIFLHTRKDTAWQQVTTTRTIHPACIFSPPFREESVRFYALVWLHEAAYASLIPLPRHPIRTSGTSWGVECALYTYTYSGVANLGRYSKSNNASKHWTWYIYADELQYVFIMMRWKVALLSGCTAGQTPLRHHLTHYDIFERYRRGPVCSNQFLFGFTMLESSIWQND